MWKSVEFLYLNHDQVYAMRPSTMDLMELVELCFQDKTNGRAQVPAKIRVSPREQVFIHAKPGYLGSLDVAGIKWQANVPDNPKNGLPNNIGLVVLTDPETGAPRAVMDCTWITALRTPAASMVAIKYLRSKSASVVSIIGLGLQGRCHLDALIESKVVPDLCEVRVYDVNPAAIDAFREYGKDRPITITACSGPEQAIRGSDVVITCTFFMQLNPTVKAEWIKPGALALPIDVGAYWTTAARKSMDRVITDDREQALTFVDAGFFPDTDLQIDAELESVIAGSSPGRVNEEERIMCMNLGLSLYDIAMAQRVYERAIEQGVGTKLRW